MDVLESRTGRPPGSVKWARIKGCPWNHTTCNDAAIFGCLEILYFVRQKTAGVPRTNRCATWLRHKKTHTQILRLTAKLENYFHLHYYLTKDRKLCTLNQSISKYADNYDLLGDIPRLMLAHDLTLSKISCVPSKSACVIVLDIKDGGTR